MGACVDAYIDGQPENVMPPPHLLVVRGIKVYLSFGVHQMHVDAFMVQVARNVYSCPEKKVHEQLQLRAKEHLKQTLNDLKSGSVESELNVPPCAQSGDRQTRQTSPRILSTVCFQLNVSRMHYSIRYIIALIEGQNA